MGALKDVQVLRKLPVVSGGRFEEKNREGYHNASAERSDLNEQLATHVRNVKRIIDRWWRSLLLTLLK